MLQDATEIPDRNLVAAALAHERWVWIKISLERNVCILNIVSSFVKNIPWGLEYSKISHDFPGLYGFDIISSLFLLCALKETHHRLLKDSEVWSDRIRHLEDFTSQSKKIAEGMSTFWGRPKVRSWIR
jgi:hypothetical protein